MMLSCTTTPGFSRDKAAFSITWGATACREMARKHSPTALLMSLGSPLTASAFTMQRKCWQVASGDGGAALSLLAGGGCRLLVAALKKVSAALQRDFSAGTSIFLADASFLALLARSGVDTASGRS